MGMLNHPHQPPSVLTRRRPEETHNGSERRALYRAHQPTIMKKRSADTRKLPVYSWTEYPRYTLGSSYPREALEMLADAAASARGMPRSSVPAEWAGGAMLDLHHFTTSADGRLLLPPLPPLMPPPPPPMMPPPPPPLVAVERGGHAPMKVETADLAPPRHHFRAPPCAEFTSDTPPSKTSPAPPSISPG
ncbi:uncharacterized protein SEPMUDRAFT_151311 [Sphaerulina musiva SO2202]|uniref:Uncharacterized protein n=1 Tax=Sphaerulina musiva (strain SO2202) TaxID=692275 RepID=N1QD73_SPHMS|nr:uncharacterized protein SEPMUDRAFT_151311 [Sphaerulina musiva SO2202]EMF09196.1 hypothetical protein SEPMUDRAFT_151311 [Sphaerulina musiva SO2202]